MIKVGIFIGTRPEAIKMALLVKLLKEDPRFACTLIATGQHKEMLDQVMADFDLCPDHYLDVMVGGQSLGALSGRIFLKVDEFLDKNQFDWILVQGDTTSVMAVGMSAFYRGIKVGHVEAGLRSDNIRSPFPEEFNRRVLGMISDFHFAPTEIARNNLVKEGLSETKVAVTGNTVIDSLLFQVAKDAGASIPTEIQSFIDHYPRFVLITGHRRENFGIGFDGICASLQQLAAEYPDVGFLYPVHMNPKVREPVLRNLGATVNIRLVEPVSYKCFIQLLKLCRLVLTDSGGVQEEAPSLGKPVLIMRENTERPEGVQAGCARLVGTDPAKICIEVRQLLDDPNAYAAMSTIANPYGDGSASKRILNSLIELSY